MRAHPGGLLLTGACLAGFATDAAAATATIAWRFETVANYISHRAAVADDGTVYVNDSSGFLHALSPDGTLLWSYDGGGLASQGPTVIGDDGTIYFGTASTSAIHAVNPDGSLKWMFEDPDSQGPIGGPGVGPDGNIYAVFDLPSDLGVVSLSPDGELLWNNVGDPVVKEYGQLGRELVFGAGQLFWTSENSSALYSFEMDTGDQLFQVDVSSPGQAAIGKQKKRWVVYVPTGIGPRLHAYDVNGNLKWEFGGNEATITNVLSAPHAAGGRVFINRNLSELYSLGPTGDVKWSEPSLLEQGTIPGPIVSPTLDLVLIGGQETYGKPGLIQGFDPVTGDLEFEIDLPKEADGSCAVPYARATFSPDGTRAYIAAAQLCVAPAVYLSWLYAIDIAL